METANVRYRRVHGWVKQTYLCAMVFFSILSSSVYAYPESKPVLFAFAPTLQSLYINQNPEEGGSKEGQDSTSDPTILEGVDPAEIRDDSKPAIDPIVEPPETSGLESEDGREGDLRPSSRSDEAVSSGPFESLTNSQRLRRANNLFEYGDCESVVDILKGFAASSTPKETSQLVDSHRMLGVCYYQLDRKVECIRELRGLLYLRPNYEMDPFLTPPPVVELLEQLRVEMHSKLEEIKAAQDDNVDGTEHLRVHVIERGREVRVTPWAVILLPFGIAQWVNGSPIKAGLFGAMQGGFLAMNVSSFWAGYLLAPDNKVNSDEEAVLHGILWWAHMGALFFGALAYGAGVVDAWWNWEEEVEVSVRERENSPIPESEEDSRP